MTNYTQSYSSGLVKRIFTSGAMGNVLETYDLILISLMATTLSNVFFPPALNPMANVINILYVFLIGLLIRPIGNIVMGLFADQVGRKKLMVISLVLTGIGTALIGLLPDYNHIGIWSTILFIVLRISQNFFAGIEYINSATYLIESSNKQTRGYYGSWAAIGISGGYLLASLMALMVTYLITIHVIPEWSWRFLFLFSLIGIGFGIWIRFSIPESFIFMANNTSIGSTRKWKILNESIQFIKENPLRCLSISFLTLLGTFLSFIYYIYIPIYLATSRDFTKSQIFSLNVLCLSLIVILIPFFGKLSDLYNRINLLKAVTFSIAIIGMPFFWYATHGSYFQILICCILISIPAACFFSLYPVIITESFPSKIRCTAASLIYQIIVSLEMGILPLLINYLINGLSWSYAPGYLLIFSCLICFLGLHFLKKADFETNDSQLSMA